MSDSDVPSPIDLRIPADARAWEQAAMLKRPYRRAVIERIGDDIAAARRPIAHVLELGSGPGFLAAYLLQRFPGLAYTMLDFSAAMHALARRRLGADCMRVRFLTRDLREPGWAADLGTFGCVATLQAVHELRHKRHALALHGAVRSLLTPGGLYLVCDHFCGDGGMSDGRLFMTLDEQREALGAGGFAHVDALLTVGSLCLLRATC
ncbi:MAG TPA: class I SAM-dependent methyltransferase [Gammaproteobacteria bacterium]|nr:class I SAM-dependent methyltransferase [Gammaproteobacteria bacterium]